MTIKINGHEISAQESSGTEFIGNVILSDIDETGTSAVKNIVVLSQASYDALTPNQDGETLYFIT
jgi:hypothetical protein